MHRRITKQEGRLILAVATSACAVLFIPFSTNWAITLALATAFELWVYYIVWKEGE